MGIAGIVAFALGVLVGVACALPVWLGEAVPLRVTEPLGVMLDDVGARLLLTVAGGVTEAEAPELTDTVAAAVLLEEPVLLGDCEVDGVPVGVKVASGEGARLDAPITVMEPVPVPNFIVPSLPISPPLTLTKELNAMR